MSKKWPKLSKKDKKFQKGTKMAKKFTKKLPKLSKNWPKLSKKDKTFENGRKMTKNGQFLSIFCPIGRLSQCPCMPFGSRKAKYAFLRVTGGVKAFNWSLGEPERSQAERCHASVSNKLKRKMA